MPVTRNGSPDEVKYKTDYQIVSESTKEDFANKVNALLDEGWILHGAPFYADRFMGIVQALTRTIRID
jgi:Uncharacterized conserved small protein